MLNLQTISTVVGVFVGVGALAAGIGFAYAQFRSGGDKYKDSIISALKDNNKILEDKNKSLSDERSQLVISHQEQINKLVSEVGNLNGRLTEQAKLAEEYKSILQGRGPEQEKYQRDVRDFMSGVAKYMESSSRVFERLDAKADKVQQRNEKVDLTKKKSVKIEVK